jgi:hypothetical protein
MRLDVILESALKKVHEVKQRPVRVYLACPYSVTIGHSKSWEAVRFELANIAAMALINRGAVVFSPISHSHPIALTQPVAKNTHSLWLSQDFEFLKWADLMVILDLPGVDESYGVRREIQFCSEHLKPCVYASIFEFYGLEESKVCRSDPETKGELVECAEIK